MHVLVSSWGTLVHELVSLPGLLRFSQVLCLCVLETFAWRRLGLSSPARSRHPCLAMEAVQLAKAKQLPREMLRAIKAFVGPGRHGVATPSATAISSFISTIRMDKGQRWGPISDEEFLREAIGRDWGLNKFIRGHFDNVTDIQFVHRKLGHLLQFVIGDSYELLRSCDAEGHEFRLPGMIYVDPHDSDDPDVAHHVVRLGIAMLAVNTRIDMEVAGHWQYMISATFARFGNDGIDYFHRDGDRPFRLFTMPWHDIASVTVVVQ